MNKRTLILALLAVAASGGAASAGVTEWGNPGGDELRGKLAGVRVAGKITGFKVTSKHGRSVEVRLPHPASLEAPLTLPAGEWAEITLTLAGTVTARSGATALVLEVDSLTVPLEDPDSRQVQLGWTLPADPGTLSAEALILALQDGGLAAP